MNKTYLLVFGLLFFCQNVDAQADTVPPVLVCKQYSSIGFFLCNLSLSVNDFVDSLSDDNSPVGDIKLGIRKRCVGNGFPENKDRVHYYDGNDYGWQTVEVWARDKAGNISIGYSSFILTEYLGMCCLPGNLTGIAHTVNDETIDSVKFNIRGQNCLADTVDVEGFSSDDWTFEPVFQSWEGPSRPGYDFTVTPSKNDDPLNGVTEQDLTLISRHILGIEPFDSPYKIIAADASQDGQVTSLDIKILRNLLLGNIDQLPNGKSWRFVPYDHKFPSVIKPFSAPFPEKIEVSNSEDPMPSYFGFIGVKIGDVDFSADPN
ncbi:MAG: dockerin type I domain-containing protein [Saprospiraceae bacterium]|nr:dockerin type I domain-containing protein [Saprospiraceae bacterium]